MRKIGLIFVALLLFACAGSAQIPTGNVFFGYSFYNTNLSLVDRANTNGWEATVEGKILPWVGIAGDFTAIMVRRIFRHSVLSEHAHSTPVSVNTTICLARECQFP
jgi:hypothetical protein